MLQVFPHLQANTSSMDGAAHPPQWLPQDNLPPHLGKDVPAPFSLSMGTWRRLAAKGCLSAHRLCWTQIKTKFSI